jgi:hypothetical protein
VNVIRSRSRSQKKKKRTLNVNLWKSAFTFSRSQTGTSLDEHILKLGYYFDAKFFRYVANVIVGRLSSEEYLGCYLLNTVQLEKTNAQTIAKVFNDSLQLLWPEGILHDKVFLFVTDAAAYMKKAAKSLKILYTRMIHVTCLAHAFHRVAEAVRGIFSTTDKFITCMKQIFSKAPYRNQKFKEMCPGLALPPQPIITRWGTWITAAEYYADNLNDVENVIISLDNDAVSIVNVKNILQTQKDELKAELCRIKTHYVFLTRTIIQLETQGLTLSESLAIMAEAIRKITIAPDAVIREKMAAVLEKNHGLKQLSAVMNLNMDEIKKYDEFHDTTPTDLASFKFAPIVSCDVERSFSDYKNLLTDNRRSFSLDHLKMHLVTSAFVRRNNSK